jgi:hypothetical protein
MTIHRYSDGPYLVYQPRPRNTPAWLRNTIVDRVIDEAAWRRITNVWTPSYRGDAAGAARSPWVRQPSSLGAVSISDAGANPNASTIRVNRLKVAAVNVASHNYASADLWRRSRARPIAYLSSPRTSARATPLC